MHGINLHTIGKKASKSVVEMEMQVCIRPRAINQSRKEIIKQFDLSEDLYSKVDASAFTFLERMRRYGAKDEMLNLMHVFAFEWDNLEW